MFSNYVKFLCLLSIGLFSFESFSQNTQTIKGRIVDKNTFQPLPGANVFIMENGELSKGVSADIDGNFRLEGISLGRKVVQCTFIGYEPWQSGYMEVTSAKEIVLTIELTPSVFTGEEVVVTAERIPGEASNEFTKISGRSFTAEETQRYAGSINDPGRMAMSIPGVQFSQQDNENTMVVRGNSPFGLSWRLEGMEIINPNHFADTGGSGGGISALSIFVLGESDFLSGAFAPEYGNAYSGIVDMNFRKGNTENYENRFQIGVIGIDFASEGPINRNRKKSSYLINYRYSTLGLLNAVGVRVVSPNVANVFQDLSFNLYFPLSKKTFLTVFGLGGLSLETREPLDEEWDSWNDYRQYSYPTRLGTAGATLTHLINDKSFIKTAVSIGHNSIEYLQDTVNLNLLPFRIENERYSENRLVSTINYNKQVNRRFNYKTGVNFTQYFYDVSLSQWDYRENFMRTMNSGKENPALWEAYYQGIYRINESWSVTGGLHGQFFTLNNSQALEPRMALSYNSKKNFEWNLGYGHHSRILPFNFYETTFTDNDNNIIDRPNKNLDMIRAKHLVTSFGRRFGNNLRVMAEPFYQHLYNIPVSNNPASTYAAINHGDFFEVHNLQNTGEGRNYGAEFTFEKFFYNQLFFLATGSIYESEYKTNNGGDDVWYDTKYNSNFNTSVTTGKEWQLSRDRVFELGGRMLLGGGLRYTPIDKGESLLAGRAVGRDDQAYSEKTMNYFRIDLRIAYRKNTPERSWKLSLDLQNATNRENLRRPFYDRADNEVKFDLQSSLIPAISYTLDF